MKRANSVYITYVPWPDIGPEQARDARARALRFAIDRYFEKQKVAKTSGDDGKRDLGPLDSEGASGR
jgi:hypothetical protein